MKLKLIALKIYEHIFWVGTKPKQYENCGAHFYINIWIFLKYGNYIFEGGLGALGPLLKKSKYWRNMYCKIGAFIIHFVMFTGTLVAVV